MPEVQHPLFVYGTLLTGERAHSLLANIVARVESATLSNATLYSLGAYPMLVDGSSQVAGELYWIEDNAYPGILTSLDGYEGPQYVRELRTVKVRGNGSLEDADSTQAWVYIGREVPLGSILIHDGDWRRHCEMDIS